MARGLSPGSIDALGRRIAKAALPTATDVATLAELQREYAGPLDAVVEILRTELGTPLRFGRTALALTARVKTPSSLVDELRRGASLSSVQDVVGLRIVGAMNLREQDSLTARILELLPDSTIVDRRRNPMHGYRAVHVVARYSGIPVEIQVRTRYQQAWAEATERLADSWGRGIRSGRAPVGRTKAEVADRAAALAKWELVAERITRLEREITSLTDELSSRILAALQADRAEKPADVAARLVSEDPTLTEAIKAASAAMSTVLREGGLELASLESAR
jgi:ppGpp synthetase/RelA/SpoT-type nucleotidyltranferase